MCSAMTGDGTPLFLCGALSLLSTRAEKWCQQNPPQAPGIPESFPRFDDDRLSSENPCESLWREIIGNLVCWFKQPTSSFVIEGRWRVTVTICLYVRQCKNKLENVVETLSMFFFSLHSAFLLCRVIALFSKHSLLL